MRLLRIVPLASRTGRYGGPYDTARRQLVIFHKMGLEATLLAGVLAGDEASPLSSHQLVKVRLLSSKVGLPSLFSFRFAGSAIKATLRADVVHVTFSRELIPIVASMLTLLFRRKLILQPHGMMTQGHEGTRVAYGRLLGPLLRKASCVVALTDVEKSHLIRSYGLRSDRVTALGNPVDGVGPITNLADPHAFLDILFLARLHPRKRVADFIELAERCFRGGPGTRSVTFSIVGPDGGDLPMVTRAASRLPNLRYEGSLSGSQVTERVKNADIFVLCSEHEPFGNVLLTALACGLAVVLPRSAHLANEVEAHSAGVVYDDRDVESLTKHVLRLTESPAQRATLGRHAREFVLNNTGEVHQVRSWSAIIAALQAPNHPF